MSIDLKTISKTGEPKPPRVIVYGVHGVGKSTFASNARTPVFIRTEDGLAGIKTDAFPVATSFDEVLDALRTLYSDKHDFKTVIVDSLDWLEPLVWKATALAHGKENIEDFGYGKGYVIALDYWRRFYDGLDALRTKRGMTVVLTSHCEIRRFDAPDSEPFDRYQPRLHKTASALAMEWTDVLAFANYKVHTKESDVGFGQKRTRAIGTGERLLHTAERPAYLAKTRYDIPETLPLEWGAFSSSIATAFGGSDEPTKKKEKVNA